MTSRRRARSTRRPAWSHSTGAALTPPAIASGGAEQLNKEVCPGFSLQGSHASPKQFPVAVCASGNAVQPSTPREPCLFRYRLQHDPNQSGTEVLSTGQYLCHCWKYFLMCWLKILTQSCGLSRIILWAEFGRSPRTGSMPRCYRAPVVMLLPAC